MARYIMIGRQLDGNKVANYILMDMETHEIGVVSKENTYTLIKTGQVKDITLQVYKGVANLRSKNIKISNLPRYDANFKLINNLNEEKKVTDIVISGKVLDGKKIKGYKLSIIEDNIIINEVVLSREDIIEMALAGKIKNATCHMSNGEYILRGIDCCLRQLPIVEEQPSGIFWY